MERKDELIAEGREIAHEALDAVFDGDLDASVGFSIARQVTDAIVALPEPLESISDLALKKVFDGLERKYGRAIDKAFRKKPAKLKRRIKAARKAGRKRAVKRLQGVLERVEARQDKSKG